MAKFKMPTLGADMEAGTLIEWLVEPGDNVKRGDVVAVVETQKGAIDIEIYLTGEVRVRFRSDYFPLERFADSAAIQLINQHAHVATATPAPAAEAPGQGGTEPPATPELPAPPPLPPMDSPGGGT